VLGGKRELSAFLLTLKFLTSCDFLKSTDANVRKKVTMPRLEKPLRSLMNFSKKKLPDREITFVLLKNMSLPTLRQHRKPNL
jgi:hypothetical protein